ncbi:GNAT family N-acetyltransferase [Pseudomonas sp. CDFA 610]|uniref:GNAT family N-acetyltransferase n=1 Tax=Pseudomonas sp. CDFA 610 TaxID=2829825 RepID=UPI001E4B483C|nr:GNAT family N-acetyltransferase [Pseudomonas sp. CDFA 610]MCD5984614.1 GNAT family N-acetyltransferase [Pseudomonas sp. CDFA 610]MEE4744012.1 GNAT family N-acetyltransferase [Pseudomonas alliivorans]
MDMLRPYLPANRDICLEIFDSNTPRFFDPSERDKFARFLLDPVGSYFVLERDGEVLACGGYLVLADPSMAELTWGMVAGNQHGNGLGRFLTLARLELMRALPSVTHAYINTSQLVQGFYSGLGFSVTRLIRDGHGVGIDSVEMTLEL